MTKARSRCWKGWRLCASGPVLFPVGIALHFVWYGKKNEAALACGKCGAWGLLVCGILLWMILGIAL